MSDAIKKRDFKPDAWEFCRQHGAPGDVSIVEKAMEFGWDRGLLDATRRIERLRVEEIKRRANGIIG